MLKKGMKIRLVESLGYFKSGEIFEVTEVVNDDFVLFAGDGADKTGVIGMKLFERYFEVCEDKEEIIAPKVTQEQVDEILSNSDVGVATVFDKCTIVSVRLPNGFVITESSACVSPENYDEEMGYEICMNRITNKIWELEGYRLQCELYDATCTSEDECDCPHDEHCMGCGLCD